MSMIPPHISAASKEELKTMVNQNRHPVDVAVWHTTNYFNFGAIVRSCHNFAIRSIHAIEVAPDSGLMYEKATMGTHKYENIVKDSIDEFIEFSSGRNIVAFERRHDLMTSDIRNFEYPDNPILLFGSEKFGVPDVLLERAKHVVHIPQFGIHNDMNLAVAVGIVLYDFVSKMK